MITLIFHDSQKLKLIQLQKKIIEQLNFSKNFEGNVYAQKPLQILLSYVSDDETPKSASKKIKSVTLKNLEIEEKMIFCNVEIEYENQLHWLKMPFVNFIEPVTQQQSNEAAILFPDNFPQKVSVFRLAKKIDLSENAQVLEDSVWKKL